MESVELPSAYAYVRGLDIEDVSGHLHSIKFAVLNLGDSLSFHVCSSELLRQFSAVTGRLADELEAARAEEVSEVEQLRRRVAELEAGERS